MTPERRAILDAAGSVEVDPAKLFGLSDAQVRLAEYRAALAREVRRLRNDAGLSQREMADLLKLTQGRISLIESGEASIDATAKTIVEMGGHLLDPPIVQRKQAGHVIYGRHQPKSFTRPVRRPRYMAKAKAARRKTRVKAAAPVHA